MKGAAVRKKIVETKRVTLTLATKVTPDEYDLIKQAAETQKRTMSNYARLVLIGAARNQIATKSKWPVG